MQNFLPGLNPLGSLTRCGKLEKTLLSLDYKNSYLNSGLPHRQQSLNPLLRSLCIAALSGVNEMDQALEKTETVLDWIDNIQIESSEFPL